MSTKDVRLYGHLGKRFGKRFRLDVGSVGETFRALDSQLPGFAAYVAANGSYRVLVGKDACTLDTLGDPVGSMEVIKIVPVVAGAHGDLGQILLGAALIAVAWWNPLGWSTVAGSWGAAGLGAMSSIGMAMVLGGVAGLLAAPPRTPTSGSDTPSYSFGSPTATVGQGNPVPLFYGGPLRVGGAVVSAGIVSEDYQSKGFGGAATDDLGNWSGNGDSIPWCAAVAPLT